MGQWTVTRRSQTYKSTQCGGKKQTETTSTTICDGCDVCPPHPWWTPGLEHEMVPIDSRCRRLDIGWEVSRGEEGHTCTPKNIT